LLNDLDHEAYHTKNEEKKQLFDFQMGTLQTPLSAFFCMVSD
jgi:hypothetical protein